MELNSELERSNKKINDLKEAFVNYRQSEGCGCCSDYEQHSKDEDKIGKLLGFPKYKDSSGYNFKITQ